MNRLDTIKNLINQGDIEQAIKMLEEISSDEKLVDIQDEVFYLLGNAYRKLGNWQQSLNHYQKAIEINPSSPAIHARKAIIDILDFFHKDMYNQ